MIAAGRIARSPALSSQSASRWSRHVNQVIATASRTIDQPPRLSVLPRGGEQLVEPRAFRGELLDRRLRAAGTIVANRRPPSSKRPKKSLTSGSIPAATRSRADVRRQSPDSYSAKNRPEREIHTRQLSQDCRRPPAKGSTETSRRGAARRLECESCRRFGKQMANMARTHGL